MKSPSLQAWLWPSIFQWPYTSSITISMRKASSSCSENPCKHSKGFQPLNSYIPGWIAVGSTMTILDLSFPYVAQCVFTLERWGCLDHMSPSLYSPALSSFKNILFSHLKLLCIIVKHPSIADLFNAINKSPPTVSFSRDGDYRQFWVHISALPASHEDTYPHFKKMKMVFYQIHFFDVWVLLTHSIKKMFLLCFIYLFMCVWRHVWRSGITCGITSLLPPCGSGLVASVSTHRIISLAPSWIVLAFLHGMGLLCASFWSRDTGLLSDF